MLSVIVFAQIATAQATAQTNYSSQALQALVAEASVANRLVPDSLAAYTSRIETEASLLIRDTLGREQIAELEQLATVARWTRGGRYDLHIIGYRSQSAGVPYSTLSIVRGWTVPSLYGERLSLGAYINRARGGTGNDTLLAVHPFAADRDSYYEFSGGDTVTTLGAGARRIPIVRIRVRPRRGFRAQLAALDGEIDVDAQRKQIVRMRGRFVTIDEHLGLGERITRAALGITAAAYIEFVNAEIGGKYWLPSYQRTEFQVGFGAFGQLRPVLRLVSTIGDIELTEGRVNVDSSECGCVSIGWAPSDSVDRFKAWSNPTGSLTASVHSDDFDDIAPDAWRRSGSPRVDVFPNSLSRDFRFNKVEGLYLGVSPTVDFRSAAPGLSVGANAGWAFAEKTLRGGAFVSYRPRSDVLRVRAERSLVSTNDFAAALSDDPGFAAVLASIDDYDYVDRSTATIAGTHTLGAVSNGFIMVEAGVVRDRGERARIARGLFGSSRFRPNRGVLAVSYPLVSADIELHPNVNGDMVTPGIGMRVHDEATAGPMHWQRSEVALAARQYLGPLSFAAHLDGGILTGHPVPQKLFELGGNESLPGYAYKSFAGDRALLFRAYSGYRSNLMKRPIRIGSFFLPGLNPGLGVSIQGGWTELSSPAAQAAALDLGSLTDTQPLSVATHGIRATVGGGLTFLSDMVHLGIARPIDQAGHWRFAVGSGFAF